MALYGFVWDALAWTVTVLALWPVNVPLAFLGYRVWSKNTPPPDTEWSEIWMRSALAALVIGLASVVMVVLDYLLVAWADLPAGPIHLTVFLALLALATWLLMLFYEIEDFFEAFSLFIIYVYLPVLVLWGLNWLLGFWNPLLTFVKAWLAEPRA